MEVIMKWFIFSLCTFLSCSSFLYSSDRGIFIPTSFKLEDSNHSINVILKSEQFTLDAVSKNSKDLTSHLFTSFETAGTRLLLASAGAVCLSSGVIMLLKQLYSYVKKPDTQSPGNAEPSIKCRLGAAVGSALLASAGFGLMYYRSLLIK